MSENIGGYLIKKSCQQLPVWTGPTIADTYGGKSVLDYKGTPLFAELYVLSQYEEEGYNGVWVDTFRRVFRTELPEQKQEEVLLPDSVQHLLNQINTDGKLSGTWDLILWKGNNIRFVELKRKGKDRIRQSQVDFLKRALKAGVSLENFEVFEWTLV